MGRIRTIKPDFFLDDQLDELDERVQKLFVGLWTLADKEGKLADAPKKIKAQIFPYREYDVDAMLGELHDAKFIHRYELAGVPVIKVAKFEKHQRPHPKETALGYPDPPKEVLSREKKRQEIKVQPAIPSSPARKGREGVLDNGSGKEILDSGNGNQKPRPSAPVFKSPDVVKVEQPVIPREKWSSGDFQQWAQWIRQRVKLVPEDPLPIHELEAWWYAATQWSEGAIEPLCQAFLAFGKDTFWEAKDPPFPFRAFVSQWKKYFKPAEKPHAA